MPSIPALSALASWRTLVLLFALLNLKSLPLAWHMRLFYHMFTGWYSKARVERTIISHSQSQSASKATHPIFEPVSVYSRSPLLETDYNLHKSNSTYFADLDESRTALVTKFILPALTQSHIDLERDGHKGKMNVILGSVHTSFHREIKPYERYEVRSRILGWDKKWIVIGSWFVRPKREGGKDEVLLASALGKYVVKKGNFTVPPERCFTTAGWLPLRPLEEPQAGGTSASSEEPSILPTPQEGLSEPIPSSLTLTTDNLVETLKTASEKIVVTELVAPHAGGNGKSGGQWDWQRIETERIRGLQIAANWLALDKELTGNSSKDSFSTKERTIFRTFSVIEFNFNSTFPENSALCRTFRSWRHCTPSPVSFAITNQQPNNLSPGDQVQVSMEMSSKPEQQISLRFSSPSPIVVSHHDSWCSCSCS